MSDVVPVDGDSEPPLHLLTDSERLRLYQSRTASTAPDALRYPDDYQKPADTPAAMQTLAQDTQVGLNNVRGHTVGAGAGLTGGGALGSNPALGVDFPMLDARWSPKGTVQIPSWDLAVENGVTYSGNSAGNSPSGLGGWWYGWVLAHHYSDVDPTYFLTQFALPFSDQPIDSNALMVRHRRSGVWGSWSRLVNFGALSWQIMDNFLTIRHGGNAGLGVPATALWAVGNKKDPASNSPTAAEQFRIQRYDTAGNYAGNVMTASTSGVVAFPGGHARAMEAIEGNDPITNDTAATVGVVAEMVLRALENVGLLDPGARGALGDAFGINLVDGAPEKDVLPEVRPDETKPPVGLARRPNPALGLGVSETFLIPPPVERGDE